MVLRRLSVRGDVADADWLHLNADEAIEWTGRPSRYTIAVAVAIALGVALAGVVLTLLAQPWVDDAGLPGWLGLLPLGLTVIGLARAGWVYVDWLRELYVVTDEAIYVKRGLLSRDVTQVRLDRVQNTSFEQSIRERLLEYGDVQVFTAGTNTGDLRFRSVPDPQRVTRILARQLRDQPGRPVQHTRV